MDTLLEHLHDISKNNPMSFYLGLTHLNSKVEVELLRSPSTSENIIELISNNLPDAFKEKVSFDETGKITKLLYIDESLSE